MKKLHPATIVIEAIDFLRQFVWTLILVLFAGSRRDSFNFEEIIIAGFGLVAVFVAIFRYYTMKYGIIDNTLIIRKGIIWKQERTIPLARIQNVNLKRGLLEQILGVVTVTVETASGIGVEANLRVLSTKDAEAIRESLLKLSGHSTELQAEPIAPPILYSASFKDLMFYGAFSNRAFYLLALLASLIPFSHGDFDFIKKLFGTAMDQASKLPVQQIAIIIMTVLLVGWVGSMLITLVQLHDFKVLNHQTGVEVQYGLITQYKTLIPTKRVIGVKVSQPIIFRWMKRCEVYADSAGSIIDNSPAGANHIAPMVHFSNVSQLVKFALPKLEFDFMQWNRVNRKAIKRAAFSSFRFLFVTILIASLKFGIGTLFLLIPAIPVSYFYAVLRYRTLGYSLIPGFFCAKSGILKNNMTVVPLDRIQSIFVEQSPFQRLWGLAELHCITASTTGMSHFQIPDLALDDAVNLQDKVLEQVEQIAESERGGV